MANKFHSKMKSGKGPVTGKRGSSSSFGPEKTANWPGIPGKGGPNRSGGTQTSGKLGKFNVKKEGFTG